MRRLIMENVHRLLSTVLVAAVLAAFSLSVLAKQTVSRNADFCALDMSFSETIRFVDLISAFQKKANRDMENRRYYEETLTIEDSVTKLELKEEFTVKALEKGPNIATELT